jgi:hypothetical protein
MFYIAGLLAILAGLFYSAGLHDLGSTGGELCSYAATFCDKPLDLLVAGGLAAS